MLNLAYLHDLYERHTAIFDTQVASFTLKNRTLDFNKRPYLMGVVNLSADSWYRESVCLSVDQAIQRGQLLTLQGADIIDIGAESTLAHAVRVNDLEQNEKLLPIIQELSAQNICLSIETYEPNVAKASFKAGANILNLTGNFQDRTLYQIVADYEGAVILCYVQGQHVRAVKDFNFTKDPIQPMQDFFSKTIETALQCGVKKILIDPGLGFYYENLKDNEKRVRYQMETFLHTFRLRQLGFPVCHALPHAFEYFQDEVRSAEPFFATLALLGKTDLLRTHEIAKVQAVLKTLSLFSSSL